MTKTAIIEGTAAHLAIAAAAMMLAGVAAAGETAEPGYVRGTVRTAAGAPIPGALIFIDGVLVGDLGGVHGAASLSINFKTGEVKLGDARKNPNTTWGGKETTLRACFEEALGKEKAAAKS